MINNRQNNRRRGRGGGPRPNGANPGNDRGNRIDNRARGNANQLFEKYKTLARDAQLQGDRVMSEYYFQFADHYFRVLNESRSRFEEQNRGRQDQGDRDDQYDYGDEGQYAAEAPAASRYAERDYREQQQPVSTVPQPQPTAPEVIEEPARAYAGNGHNGSNGELPLDAPKVARGRRPRVRKDADLPESTANGGAQDERIEIDRLPPAFAGAAEAEPAEEKPKRRGRRPRSETTAEV